MDITFRWTTDTPWRGGWLENKNIFSVNFKTTLIDGGGQGARAGSRAIIPSKYRRLAFWSLSVNKEPLDAVLEGKGEKQEIILPNLKYFIPPPFHFLLSSQPSFISC